MADAVQPHAATGLVHIHAMLTFIFLLLFFLPNSAIPIQSPIIWKVHTDGQWLQDIAIFG